MRKLFAIVVLLALTAPAKAEETLSTLEKSLVVNLAMAGIVSKECGATLVSGGMDRLADKLGTSGDTIFYAVLAANAALAKQPYDSTWMVPAVTRQVLEVHATVTENLRRDKAKTCASVMKMLRENGVVE
jgi:hypothetical protein